MGFNHYEFGLTVAQDRQDLYNVLTALIAPYSHLIDTQFDSDRLFILKSKRGNFYFYIDEPHADEKKVKAWYKIRYKPLSAANPREASDTQDSQQIKPMVEKWLRTVEDYANFPPDPRQANLDKLQTEVEQEWFEPGADISDTEFYDYERQKMLYAMLERLRLPLSQIEEPEAKDILKDVQELQSEITKLPQRPTVNKLRSIYAKIRKWGIKRADELYDVGKKEVYKAILNGTIDDKIRGLIDLFN